MLHFYFNIHTSRTALLGSLCASSLLCGSPAWVLLPGNRCYHVRLGFGRVNKVAICCRLDHSICFCKCIQPTACWQAMNEMQRSMLNNRCNLLTVQCFHNLKTAAIDNMRDSQVCMNGNSSLLQGCSMLLTCHLRGLKCMHANRRTQF